VGGTNRNLGWTLCAGAVLALVAALISGAQARSAENGPRAEAAWVRPGLAMGRPAAGYMVVHGGARADRLTGVMSSAATSVELHETMKMAGIMHMSGTPSVDVPAGGTVRFAPGGRHLMIFGLKAGTEPVPLTLAFASGVRVRIDALRRSATLY